VGITREQQHSMWRVCAGIMHLGNVEFGEDPATGLAFVVNPAAADLAGTYLGTPSLGMKLVRAGGGGGKMRGFCAHLYVRVCLCMVLLAMGAC
jgi:hypothetical protein